MDLGSELHRVTMAALHYANMEDRIFVVSRTHKAYEPFSTISLVDHMTFPKELRPEICRVVFPHGVMNKQAERDDGEEDQGENFFQ